MLASEWLAKYEEEHEEECMVHCVCCGKSPLRDRGPSAHEPGLNEFECPNGHTNVYSCSRKGR